MNHPLLFLIALLLCLVGASLCQAEISDLQITRAAVQGDCIVLTVFNPSSDTLSVKYSASAILANGTEETKFSNGFIITPGQSLQVPIEFSGMVLSGGGEDPTPWPWS